MRPLEMVILPGCVDVRLTIQRRFLVKDLRALGLTFLAFPRVFT